MRGGMVKPLSLLIPLSLINRQMMYVHTLFIALLLLLMVILCLTSSNELVSSALERESPSVLEFSGS